MAALYCGAGSSSAVADDADRIHLNLAPRICTLSGKDKQCETTVHAEWRSPQNESLCLVIADRPDVKRCWENFSRGAYSVSLVFNDDLRFELRDPQLQTLLTSKVLKVIREALEYRHKRRQPWNIIY